jgi:hypothetical protein
MISKQQDQGTQNKEHTAKKQENMRDLRSELIMEKK